MRWRAVRPWSNPWPGHGRGFRQARAQRYSYRPLRILRSSLMVMLPPLGTPETYFETGSSKRNFPSWTSSTITAAVIVLVFQAILKCVSGRGSVVPPSSLVPYPNTNTPPGVASRTMAPGTMSSLAVASTVSRSAAGSKGLRFVADAAVAPREHATATASARIRVVMISLLGHADELTVGPPTCGYGTSGNI